MKRIRSILIGIVTFLLVIVVIFNIYNFVCIKVLNKDIATVNGYAVLEVVSGSMEPNISIGDLIIIDTKVKDYKVKDVVTFYDVNGSFVTHRIIEIFGDKIVTQGDANNTIDEAISKDDIVGRYVFKIKGIGYLINSFRTPFIMIMILVIGVLVVFLVSTDKDGKAILTNDEKEFLEFKEYKKNKDKVIDEPKKEEVKKTTTKKVSAEKKTSTKKSDGTKKDVTTKKSNSAKNGAKTKTSTKKKDEIKITTTKKSSSTKKTTTKKNTTSTKKKSTSKK